MGNGQLTLMWAEFCRSPEQQTYSGPHGLDPTLEVVKLLHLITQD